MVRWRRGAGSDEQIIAPEAPAEQRPRGYTPPKARPTPKRDEAAPPVRPRGPVAPPPQTRREAYRRVREESKSSRGDARRRIAAGDDAVLGKRDRGPARRLTRDVVDAQRSPLTLFLPVFAVYALTPLLAASYPQVQSGILLVLLVLFLFMGLGAVQLGRLITSTVSARIPDHGDKPRSLVLYGVLRATLPRRLRTPKARVRSGDAV